MKHKNLVGITALCCASMLLFACNNNKKPTPHGPTTYTVTFYSEGEVYTTQEVEENELATRPETDPTKEGHNFVGWFTQEAGGEEWVFAVNEVTQDTDLFAHFELGRVDYTINILLDGEIVESETKATNSEDQTDVILTGFEVAEGKSLLGFGNAAGSTAAAVDYRINSVLNFDDVVALANDQHVVNLHAIVKNGEMLRLNVGHWERYASDANIENIMSAFKDYADDNSVDYDFLDVTKFAAASSQDPNWGYADLATNVDADKSVTVVLPTNNNFQGALNDLDATRIKQHASLGVVISGNPDSATVRYVTRLSDDAITVAFTNWLLSDDGKQVLDPDYVPSSEHGEASSTKLILGVWGRYLTSELADGVEEAFETYLTAQGISFDDVDVVYFSNDDYRSKGVYLPAVADDLSVDVLLPVNKAIAKGTDADIPTKLANKYTTTLNLGTTDGDDEGLGLSFNEAGGSAKTDRWLVTLNNDAITEAFVTFCQTEAGKKALDPTYGEEETEVVQTTLTISFYGKFITSDAADAIISALETYFTQQSLAFTPLTKDYVTKATGNNNSNYLSNMDANADVSIGGKTNLTGFPKTVVNFVDIGSVKDGDGTSQSNRGCFTFVNGNLCNACLTFFTTSAWTTLLTQINA